jgi:hypothetical protein
MSISSQAGLASIHRVPVPGFAAPIMVVKLNSAAFELRLSRTDGHWYVIHAQGSANAQSLVGQGFEPGRNPWEWDQGYATQIQKHLNKEVQP